MTSTSRERELMYHVKMVAIPSMYTYIRPAAYVTSTSRERVDVPRKDGSHPINVYLYTSGGLCHVNK